uniref:Tyrosine specific protein phosphatases domain-containing protein n=1 Tax=Percolomonas cosmopolitus TaxID=63605 RepID=A0A7S1KNU4_9EUKA
MPTDISSQHPPKHVKETSTTISHQRPNSCSSRSLGSTFKTSSRATPNQHPKITYSLLLKSPSGKHTVRIGSAPGKFKRSLKADVDNVFVKRFGFSHVVSILTDNEYKTLDIEQQEYRKLLKERKIKCYPVRNIVDGSVPVSEAEREKFFQLVESVAQEFEQSATNQTEFHLLVHCRLGKHRSGMFCCCLLLRLNTFLHQIEGGDLPEDEPISVVQPERTPSDSHDRSAATVPRLLTAGESIAFLRAKRGQSCISREPQEELVRAFQKWNRKRGILK